MRIHPEGYKIILIVAAILICADFLFTSIIRLEVLHVPVSILLTASFVLVISFFRVYRASPLSDPYSILSPASGTVQKIVQVRVDEFLSGSLCQRISIFLSIFDTHVTRSPSGARVVFFRRHKGKYLMAFKPLASDKNEHTSIGLVLDDGSKLLIRQITGWIARRILFFKKEGDRVMSGEDIGFIRFGSRVDIFVPADFLVLVSEGDRVGSGRTLLARKKTGGEIGMPADSGPSKSPPVAAA